MSELSERLRNLERCMQHGGSLNPMKDNPAGEAADEIDRLEAELASSQADVARMRSLLSLSRETLLGGKFRDELDAALALPADRTALDAALAEAHKAGMLEAAEICEERDWMTNASHLAEVIRQAAEKERQVINFIVFMAIWFAGCAFVDYVVPDIANSWQMAIGYGVGTIAWAAAERKQT